MAILPLTVAAIALSSTACGGQAQSVGASAAAAVNGSDVEVDCQHGTWDRAAQACKCDEGWETAGITDTIAWAEGICEQFQCRDDAQCQRLLGIPTATCPVKGWNCLCDFEHAFYNAGHGYESSNAECMGVMYAFSVWSSEAVFSFMEFAWMPVVALAALALPFGRKRSMCDHQWPSLWNGIRRCFGCGPNCHGACVLQGSYTFDTFKDDIAWTIYILDVGVWLYVFAATAYVTAMFIWSFVLWLIVFVLLVLLCLFGVCTACSEGASIGTEAVFGGGGGCLDCCCDWCGICAISSQHLSSVHAMPGDAFYYSGVFPYDPIWGYTGYGNVGLIDDESHGCCTCCQRSYCCRPLAWLLYVFPVLPENAWGGLLGYVVFGTHQLTPTSRLYQGGNPVIEFFRMGWRRNADLHGDDAWRKQVYDFLVGGDRDAQAHRQLLGPERVLTQMDVEDEEFDSAGHVVIRIGRARAVLMQRRFDLIRDQCTETSFEDYQSNECWICRNSCEEWDMWLSCHHLFCKACSTEMLQRRMPCPLCRVSSSTVVRGQR